MLFLREKKIEEMDLNSLRSEYRKVRKNLRMAIIEFKTNKSKGKLVLELEEFKKQLMVEIHMRILYK